MKLFGLVICLRSTYDKELKSAHFEGLIGAVNAKPITAEDFRKQLSPDFVVDGTRMYRRVSAPDGEA